MVEEAKSSNSASKRLELSNEGLSPSELEKKVVKWEKEAKSTQKIREAAFLNREIE